MRSQESDGHEVAWDGRTVWVNSGKTGTSLARFGPTGIDIHHDLQEQLRTGQQCLRCSHVAGKLPGVHEWREFCSQVLHHHGVQVPEAARPSYV